MSGVSTYVLDPNNPPAARIEVANNRQYYGWWRAAMEMHGHLANEVPWPNKP